MVFLAGERLVLIRPLPASGGNFREKSNYPVCLYPRGKLSSWAWQGVRPPIRLATHITQLKHLNRIFVRAITAVL
jgi:hypothetical protein